MSELTPHPVDATPTHGRRQFFRIGGAGVVAAAVLAACSDDEEAPPSETGVTQPATETTFAPPIPTTPEDGARQDATVTRTARTVELAMIDVYATLLADGETDLELPEPVDYDAETRTTLELLAERHQAHADALVGLVADAGGEPVTEANNGILAGVVEPRLADLTTEQSVIQLAQSLEDVAAATYAWGTGTLTTPELRAGLMAIGAITARHGAALSLLLDPSGESATDGPLLDSSGPARLPEHMLVAEDQDGGDALAEPAPPAGEDAEAAPEEEEDDDGPETSDSTEPEG